MLEIEVDGWRVLMSPHKASDEKVYFDNKPEVRQAIADEKILPPLQTFSISADLINRPAHILHDVIPQSAYAQTRDRLEQRELDNAG